MKILRIVAVLLVLAGCSSEPDRQESVDKASKALNLTDSYTEEEVEAILVETCLALDSSPASKVEDVLQKGGDLSPFAAGSVLDNATEAFCPEHRDSYEELTR